MDLSSRQAASPSASPTQCLEVANLRDGGLYIRVAGLGNQHLAPSLQGFVESAARQGHIHCIVDLSACTGLDSTFMGTLVLLAGNLEDAGGQLCLAHVGEANGKLLRMLGVLEFVRLQEPLAMEPIETMRLTPETDAVSRLRQIINAHKSLVAIDARNQARFGHFLDAVSAELAARAKPDLPVADSPALIPSAKPGKGGGGGGGGSTGAVGFRPSDSCRAIIPAPRET